VSKAVFFFQKGCNILWRTHKIHEATEVSARGRDKTGRLPRKPRTLGKSMLSVALIRNAKFICILLHAQLARASRVRVLYTPCLILIHKFYSEQCANKVFVNTVQSRSQKNGFKNDN